MVRPRQKTEHFPGFSSQAYPSGLGEGLTDSGPQQWDHSPVPWLNAGAAGILQSSTFNTEVQRSKVDTGRGDHTQVANPPKFPPEDVIHVPESYQTSRGSPRY